MLLTYFSRHRRPLQFLLATLLVGGAVTARFVAEIERSNALAVQHNAQHAVYDALLQIDTVLTRYQYALVGIRAAVALTGTGGIDRAAFLRYSQSRDYLIEFPGARGFGFIRRVDPRDTAAYVAAQRASGLPNFSLQQFQPHTGERAIIELLEPLAPNRFVLGLDVASDPVRRAGVAAASATGKATLTAPLSLLRDSSQRRQSFLLLLPVFDKPTAAPPRTVIGWAFAPLVIDEVLAILPVSLPQGAFALADSGPGSASVRFYTAGTGAPGFASVHATRQLLGREWVATFQPSAAFVDELHLPVPMHAWLVGGAMTLLCALLGAALAAQGVRLRQLYATQEQLVTDRTTELESARRDLRAILDAVSSMIGYFDDQQRNRFANRAYCDWFGLTPEALAGQTMQNVLGAELYRRNKKYIDAALRGERTVFERIVTGRDGIARNLLITYLPDISAGRLHGFYVLVHDVSALVESRQALASALRENDVLVHTINEQLLYSVTDAGGFILEVNDNFCAAYGYRRDALVGVHHNVLSSSPYGRASWTDMRQTVTSGRTWIGTLCSLAADGKEKWFDTVVAPYFSEQGIIERYVALHTDVTARHATDMALRHVSALLGNVLRAASEMSMIATDPQGVINVFNAGAERMLGYTAAEMVGRTPASLHDNAELAARAAELSRPLGEPVEGVRTLILPAGRDGLDAREWTYVRKDGSRFPVQLTVTPMRDDSGAVLGYLGVGVDISQRKRDDAIVRESIQRAEQASIAKSQFVANMSHEIRTPMNAMLGMLELMLRTELSVRQRDYVDKARSAGGTLLALLNDVLDFSKIDAGKLEIDHHVFAVEAMLRDVATVICGGSVNQQVALRFETAPAIPAHLHGDRQRIHQVLVNLAGNALKFTQTGTVVVELIMLAEGPDSLNLRFAVTDTGIGIPASQLGMIFDGFTQAEASTARRFGGTGLGLAISARIVALMGGKLQVSSEVGRGSRFWFDINLGTVPDDVALPAVQTAPPQRECRLDGVRLLVVEDNALNRQVAFELLAAEGAQVDMAEGGQKGVDMALDPARSYDAIIMDVQMPDVDGLEATRRIRAVAGLTQLPIMAMTANASNADRDACLAAGMDSHIGKPFNIGEVVARLRGLIDRNAAALVDLADALPRFFDDPSVYAQMLDKFEGESGNLLARLETEQTQGDARAAAATLHAMKGMALTMGLTRLALALAAPADRACRHAPLTMLVAGSVIAARAALAAPVD
ncbi:MAG: PAS domain S-box protein [Pseudomonadota bacterium]|nr:PAS domain S-box protein [Pseudomonadota bacterium]